MRRILKLALLILLLGFNTKKAPAQSLQKPSERTLAHLEKFRLDCIANMLNSKNELLQKYYADTIRLLPPFQKTVMSKHNASLYYKAFTDRFLVHEMKRNQLQILDMGDQVMEVGTFGMRVTLKTTGKAHMLEGKYLNLWREMPNGDIWLITEAWNYDAYYGELHEQFRFEHVPSVHIALQPNVVVNNSISFELAALNRLLDATVTQHDANTWSLYYSDDAMLMASYRPICRGRKAIDDYLSNHVKEFPVFEELDIRNDRIDDLGVFVIEYASHIASWKNGDFSGVSLGKNIRVWRRGSDHALKLFRSIGMYD